MNNVVALAFSILTFAAPLAAARGDEDIHVEHRQQRDTITSRELAQQIDHGVARGAHSRAEARRLRGDLQDLRHLERRALNDGRITPGERRDLSRNAAHLEREIARECCDRTVRYAR